MRRSMLHRTLCIIAVFALFAAPVPLQARKAAPAHREAGGEMLPGIASRLWSFFAGLWVKNSCRIDPSGACLAFDLPAGNGCIIDPNGECPATQAGPKNGCIIDPSGQCVR